MKKLLVLALLPTAVMADPYVTLGKSIRPGAMNAAVGYEFLQVNNMSLAGEVEYIDFGRQPHTVTRNRVLNLDIVGRAELTEKIAVFAKAGVTSSMFSTPYNDYEHDKSFKGHNVGVGIQYMVTPAFGVQAFANNVYYQECSQNKMNHYLTTSLGVVYRFGQ
jgi:hypothetical protein